MQILILLLYFERPRLVRNALESVHRATTYHADWKMAFIDDGSSFPGKPIVCEVLGDQLDKLSFFNTWDDEAIKRERGCVIGDLMNKAIEESSADLGIMLCDDDMLYPTYLADLSRFFTANPRVLSAYSQVIVYDPLSAEPLSETSQPHPLNRHNGPICGTCQVDSSQVAWRLECCKVYGAWFASPCNACHDAAFYQELWNRTGPMYPTGLIGQYKGLHERQLGVLGMDEAWRGRAE